MMNYLAIDNSHIQIEHGILGDVVSFQTYPSGEIESVKLGGKNMIVTHAGELVPAYTETARRKNKPSIEFYKSGTVKAVLLEEQAEVETPIGSIPAEHVTFYPTGEIHRVFITNGQISGFWSEEDEKNYNIPLSFEFDFTCFQAYLTSICFYKSGTIKSITLYPGESISIKTPAGQIETGIGFSLYEAGELESVEPKEPILIHTAIGQFTAFDSEAVGIHADSNSVHFNREGRLTAFSTAENKILVQTEKEEFIILKPTEKPHPLHDNETTRIAMKIAFNFETDTVTITTDEERTFPLETTKFTVSKLESDHMGCTPADCASCSLCNNKNVSMR